MAHPQDMVGLAEIEDRSGVPLREIVTDWWSHPDFPQPMKVLSVGPIWYWPQSLPGGSEPGKKNSFMDNPFAFPDGEEPVDVFELIERGRAAERATRVDEASTFDLIAYNTSADAWLKSRRKARLEERA